MKNTLKFGIKSAFTCAIIITVISLILGGCGNGEKAPWSYERLASFGRTPVYSPDRTMIIFGGNEADDLGIWLRSGGSTTRLTTFSHNWDYVWSPDGTKIAFTNSSGGNNGGMWLVDTQGNLEHLSDTGRYPSWKTIPGMGDTTIFFQSGFGTGISRIFTESGEIAEIMGIGEYPRVSPNGEYIAFLVRSDISSTTDSLFLWNISSGDLESLAACGMNYDWSPDGNTITYERYEYVSNGSMLNVKVVNVNTGYIATLWTGAKNPKFCPNGNRIVFEGIAGDAGDGIFMVSPSGGSVEEVTSAGYGPECYLNIDRVIYWNTSGIWIANRN